MVIVHGVSHGLPQDLARAVRRRTHGSGAFRRRERAGLSNRREAIEFCQGSRPSPRVRCRAPALSSGGVGDFRATGPAYEVISVPVLICIFVKGGNHPRLQSDEISICILTCILGNTNQLVE